ncbi:MAG: transcriptional regulator [Bacteroidia bacterium]
MEKYKLENDIKVFYVTAKSFPDGILEAHQKLHLLIPFSTERKYYGISRPENGVIVYKAAAEEIIKDEAEKLNCDILILRKGEYICLTVNNYMNDLQSIGTAFKKLLAQKGLDPQGYCVEWYLNQKDVRCMVRLDSKEN